MCTTWRAPSRIDDLQYNLCDMSTPKSSTRRRHKKYSLAALPLGITLATTAFYAVRKHPPATLAEALLSRSEQFPKGQKLLAPLSNQDRLGYLVNPEPGSDVVTTEPSPCFFVAKSEYIGSVQLEVQYRDRGAMNLELRGPISQFTHSQMDETLAHVHITGIGVVTGLGFPNLNGPCQFQKIDKERTFSIVTTEVRADQLEVTLSESHSQETKVAVKSEGSGRSEMGWTMSGESSLIGKDIVLSAAATDVVVRVSPAARFKLGDAPHDIVVDLNQQLAVNGKLTIVGYDRLGGLTIRANVQTLPLQKNNDVETFQCVGGVDNTLHAGTPCIYWIAPGTTAVSVSWTDESRDLYLDVQAYQTSFPIH